MTAPALLDDVFEAIKAEAPAPLSREVTGGVPLAMEALQQEEDVLRQDLGLPELTPEIQHALTILYGAEFPLLKHDAPTDADWVQWVEGRWLYLGPTVQRRLWLVERNRLFRNDIQWVSSSGYGPWKEPARPRDAARIVENVIRPALDQRIQLIVEQRPGFRVRPATNDPKDKARAEAKQYALEYQYDQQSMPAVIREAAYWAGTDGVSFLESYWDPEAGPWHEAYSEEGYGIGGGEGAETPMQPQQQSPRREPMGDVRTRVRRIEQVRVGGNATATQAPWYWIVKDVMSKQEAVRVYGVETVDTAEGGDPSTAMLNNYPRVHLGLQLPTLDEMLLEQDRVIRYTVYVEKSLGLPRGLTLVTVGDKLVFQGPLLIGQVPMVRWSDGSTDPAFFPRAEMEGWIDPQMRINAVKSKWVENIRMNSGLRLLAKENSIVPDTIVGSTLNIVSAKGMGPLGDIVRPIDGFAVGTDAKELLALERKQFEDLTGWSDTSRGQFANPETSGRAILAIREQLERIFAPVINAAAYGMTGWAKVSCGFMAWGYDFPRFLGVEGSLRPDLARAVMADDFDGVTDIFIDPETLMPMPRPLKLFLLKDLYEQQLLSPQEYRRRLPFAYTRDIQSPDEDQEARARRVCEALRQGQQLRILWQDNEAIHQDVLERELILPDDTDPAVREMAMQRWAMLAQQSQMKMGVMGGMPGGAVMGLGGGGGSQQGPEFPLRPNEQPFASSNPGIAAQQTGIADDQRAAQAFDAQQRALDQGA